MAHSNNFQGNVWENCSVIKIIIIRVQFIQDYTLKSMRLKPEKWMKLVISDEQRRHLGMTSNFSN